MLLTVSTVIDLGVVRGYFRGVVVSLDLEGFVCGFVVLISTYILEIASIYFKV